MKSTSRYALIIMGFIFFLVAAPLLVLYVSGRTFDLSQRDTRATGILDAKSNPSGATVLIDDKDHSSTPAIARFLTQGEYQVTIKKDGYYDWQKRLAIQAGQVTYAQEGVTEVQLIKKSEPKTLVASGVKSFALVKDVIWYATDHAIVHAPLSSPDQQTKIALPFTPTTVARLRSSNYLLVRNGSSETVAVNTDDNSIFTVPFGGVVPESSLMAPDGTFFVLTGEILHAYNPQTKAEKIISSNVVAFTMTGSNAYFASRDGTISTAAWNGTEMTDSQNLISGANIVSGENTLIITDRKELFLKDTKGALWRVNQSLEPVAPSVASVSLDPDTDELTFQTASELWFYNFITHKPQLLTRNSSSKINDLVIRSAIGYGFVGNQTGLEAIEIDNRDKSNRYVLILNKQVWQIALSTNQKTILALVDDSLVSLEIRN
ncbi:MAG TPA: PEGA domain-containing protein [Patescibacteria group bacterium]|jgi:hypothetical protein|nr:PEGA domain-containing protein [Patescibacteria group bacterium]